MGLVFFLNPLQFTTEGEAIAKLLIQLLGVGLENTKQRAAAPTHLCIDGSEVVKPLLDAGQLRVGYED